MSIPLNICQCGAFAGYPHEIDCPFPLYTDDPKKVERWLKLRECRRTIFDMMVEARKNEKDTRDGS